jgi:hypothetical protein
MGLLKAIRVKLLFLKLVYALRLYAKKRRLAKGQARGNGELKALASSYASMRPVEKIQGMVRMRIARKTSNFKLKLQILRKIQRWRSEIRLRSSLTRVIRDRETYYVQRVTLGKIETETINKYVMKAEATFEANWNSYEGQLKKYLTSSTKQYKDWI